MTNNQSRTHAFNYQLQRLMIGIVSFVLPLIVLTVGCRDLPSISASYHTMSRDFFVACLAGVGFLMIPYQGKKGSSITEFILAKIGGVGALVVAFVPTKCPTCGEPQFECLLKEACSRANESLHIGAAIAVFGSLFFLCRIFKKRAFDKYHEDNFKTAKIRANIYTACMAAILIGAALIALYMLEVKIFGSMMFFWGEAIMLFAFSIAWLTASKLIIWDGKRPSFLPDL